MKKRIYFNEFLETFQRVRPNNFSVDGLEILFDYLEEMEQDTDEEIEFDVIGLCCDYTEASAEYIAESYGIDIKEMDTLQTEIAITEFLNENTIVCGKHHDKFGNAFFVYVSF